MRGDTTWAGLVRTFEDPAGIGRGFLVQSVADSRCMTLMMARSENVATAPFPEGSVQTVCSARPRKEAGLFAAIPLRSGVNVTTLVWSWAAGRHTVARCRDGATSASGRW